MFGTVKVNEILTDAYSLGDMPNISFADYQTEYGRLLANASKIADVRKNVSLYLYSNRIYLLVKDEHIILGNITVSPVTIADIQYSHIDAIFVPNEYRKTSVLSWLLYATKEAGDKPVIADGAIFKDGVELIDAIIKHKVFNVSKLNVITGKKSELTNQINSPNFCYVFETAKLGFNKQIFENLQTTWLPLFAEL